MPELLQPNQGELATAYREAEGTGSSNERTTEHEPLISSEQLGREINLNIWRQLLVSKQRVINDLNSDTIDPSTAETQLARIQEEINKVSPEQRFSEELKKLLEDGVDKKYIAISLAGLDTPLAWQMREDFLKDSSVNKNYIARSLAGLDCKRAWDMREKLLNDPNVDKNYIAEGLAGLDGKRAWDMREKLLNDPNVDKDYIALSLAGLDCKRAWDMRDDLLNKYSVSRGFIAYSINGDFSNAVIWRAAKGLLPYQIQKLIEKEDKTQQET
ncbi:hypothetical protein KBB60_00475 [Patescibacteria group bacterium]|nr:hypothetical protein [Patescibacteria group bacterium]